MSCKHCSKPTIEFQFYSLTSSGTGPTWLKITDNVKNKSVGFTREYFKDLLDVAIYAVVDEYSVECAEQLCKDKIAEIKKRNNL